MTGLPDRIPPERVEPVEGDPPLPEEGYTLDAHVIIRGMSVSLRDLWENDVVTPERLGDIYTARVLDSATQFRITHTTYRIMVGEVPDTPGDDFPLTPEQQRNVEKSNLPDNPAVNLKMVMHPTPSELEYPE